MKPAILVAVVALLIGLGVGYHILGLQCELEAMKNRHAQQADELRKLKAELAVEHGRRQRLEEVIRQGRK
jgi:hypothetical protein